MRLKANGKSSALLPAPLRVGLYLRKSSDDREKDEDLRSTVMQETNARKYAEKQGWVVLDEHIYKDDNYSGALVSRPDFDRLKAALGIEEGKPLRRAPDPASLPFDVLLCRDQSRLIRNADYVTKQIRRILKTGVKICYYKSGELLDIANFKQLYVGVTGLADSDYREKAKTNVREGMAAYAKDGYVCGGVVFGYTNKPHMGTSPSGQEKRLYTEYTINTEQAKVVLRIFKMFVAGYGLRVIAKVANGDLKYAELSRRL